MTVRVIALGNEMACDDGAALAAARALEGLEGVEVVLAGRPGPGLLDLLDPARPTLVLDVIRQGARPGEIVRLGLGEITRAAIDGGPLSSHGLGVAQTFRLAEALGRELPRGELIGIGGRAFAPGEARSAEVEKNIESLARVAREAIDRLQGEGGCTSTG